MKLWGVFIKIVYLTSNKIPSVAANTINIINMCQAFGQAGHDITLLMPGDKYKPIDSIYEYYGVKPIFKIVRQTKPAVKAKGLIYSLLGAIKVKSLAPDIVYSRNIRGGFMCCFLGVQLIYEAHKPLENTIDQKLFKKLIKMKKFKRLVVLSNELKQYYVTHYKISDKLLVVAYNGANDNLLNNNTPALNLALNPENLNVGYIGHLYTGKGMEVISKILRYCKWANFHIIGGFAEDVDIWKRVTAYDDNIYFYGYNSPSLLNQFQNNFDVLLLPPLPEVKVYGGKKIKQFYAPPLKLFEYMSRGKAIIGSNFLNEILVDGHNSILCDPLNFEEWVDALTLLKNNRQLREKLGCNARNDYITKYSWNDRAKKVLTNLALECKL